MTFFEQIQILIFVLPSIQEVFSKSFVFAEVYYPASSVFVISMSTYRLPAGITCFLKTLRAGHDMAATGSFNIDIAANIE